jgi:hypothetical protein
MGHWANYVGSLTMPSIETVKEECIYVVKEGRRKAVSTMAIAEADVAYWAKQGVTCTIERTVEKRSYEKVYHGPSGSEYNDR